MQDYQICFHDIFMVLVLQRISDLHTLTIRDNLSHGFYNKTELLVLSNEEQKIRERFDCNMT